MAARRTPSTLAICSLLVAANLAVYGRVVGFGFIQYDDPFYITANPQVSRGLTLHGIAWAFTHDQGGSWHPLTALTHMLDCQLWGLRPGGHHLTNLLLHTANSLLLFGVLLAMTGARWPSAAVALLFALHPLRVESVAWISGRKDLLSTLFALLSIWCYVAYARRGGMRPYLLTAVFFVMALLAKPVLVTLPLLLLLLDYWPLERARHPAALLREKLPLLALAGAFSALAYLGHRSFGTLDVGHDVTFPMRLANAAVSYVRYIVKALWPLGLGVHYSHPNLPGGTPWAWWQVAGAVGLLVAASSWVLRQRRRRYPVVGWCWYLVALLPVIGLIQAGRHGMADRYAYVPLIGLLIVAVWGVADVLAHRPRWRTPLAALGAAALVLLATRAWHQVGYWRDTEALVRHALEVAPRSPEMLWLLGHELRTQGRLDEASDYLNRALEVRPRFADAEADLGLLLLTQGRADEATRHFRLALEIGTPEAGVHNGLGLALERQGMIDEAMAEYAEALRMRPAYPEAHINLGIALHRRGDLAQAMQHYRAALAIAPDFHVARLNLAAALLTQGDAGAALEQYGEVLRREPRNVPAYVGLGRSLQAQGRLDEAVGRYRQALEIAPGDPDALTRLGAALHRQGRPQEAIDLYRRALAVRPDDAVTHNELGLALHAVGRTGEAIEHYQQALRLRPAYTSAQRNLALALGGQGSPGPGGSP